MRTKASILPLHRRRFLKLAGASMVVAAGGGGVLARDSDGYIWSGAALGTDVSIDLQGIAPSAGEALIEASIAELRRLEGLFSLYDERSLVSELNRTGRIDRPDADFVEVLRLAQRVSALTQGAFDVTVQPLVELYAGHTFAEPSLTQITATRALIGMRHLSVGHDRVTLTGGKITLNGIAQGYIADKLATLLRQSDVRHALVNIGTYTAIGRQASGEDWPIWIADPRANGRPLDEIGLAHAAIATSTGHNMAPTPPVASPHLFDPGTGRPCKRYRSVSVRHLDAGMADALSTAFHAMDLADIRALQSDACSFSALLLTADGRIERV